MMDLEQIQFLDPEQKETYMRLERLFETPGWTDLMKWALVNKMATAERQLNASNWEQNRVAYGARLAFDMLTEFEKATEMEYEHIAASAQEAAQTDEALDNE